jgi:lipoic acid synthetase
MNKKAERAKEKLKRIPIKIPVQTEESMLPKPSWAKIRLSYDPNIQKMKQLLRARNLVTVCEEATCPNLHECFSKGTATFMIMGDKCTRRCTFCDVGHGRPDPLDVHEPANLAETVRQLGLNYVVITSVDRDDLKDGGAQHFANCIEATRALCPAIKIEILVPDFRGRDALALGILSDTPPDVFNHNIETVPSLYAQARPGSCYMHSLQLLQAYKKHMPHIPTKSGLMLGLGETDEEVVQTLADLRAHQVDMVTIGQYLSPSRYHSPVKRYVTPAQFAHFQTLAENMGFANVASGFMVRSSYHADLQSEQKNLEIHDARTN